MAVVIQAMVDARTAGVMFTRSPTTGDRSVVTIEGAWGLGSSVVGGEVTPDRWVLGKITGEITVRDIADKAIQHVPRADGGIDAVGVGEDLRRVPCLSDAELEQLRVVARRVERHYGRAQDIEWAIDRGGAILLLQSRPETVWSQRDATRLRAAGGPAAARDVHLRRPQVTLTAQDVAEITRLLEESDFEELHVESDGFKLTLRRSTAGKDPAKGAASVAARPSPAAPARPVVPSPAESAVLSDTSGGSGVAAPILGTFYRAPKPGAPPYVEIGSQVGADSIIGIIEVMKLMNTVRAGVAGTVTEILEADGALVEYGGVAACCGSGTGRRREVPAGPHRKPRRGGCGSSAPAGN
jgi:acetyl-CoA carboxylase biotin carboxyl carrier protein